MKRYMVALCMAASLPACTTVGDPVEHAHRVFNTPDCCASMAEFSYEPLALPSSTDINVGDASPVFSFFAGKSHFKAFTLPRAERPYKIVLRSYVVRTRPFEFGLFYPIVVLLDEQRQTTGILRPASFRYLQSQPFDEPLDPDRIEAAVPFDPARNPARHMVIFTSPQMMTGGEYQVPATMSVMPLGQTFVPITVGGGRRSFQALPIGRLRLRLEPFSGEK